MRICMPCIIHLNYLRSSGHTTCVASDVHVEVRKLHLSVECEQPTAGPISQLLHDKEVSNNHTQGFVQENVWKING